MVEHADRVPLTTVRVRSGGDAEGRPHGGAHVRQQRAELRQRNRSTRGCLDLGELIEQRGARRLREPRRPVEGRQQLCAQPVERLDHTALDGIADAAEHLLVLDVETLDAGGDVAGLGLDGRDALLDRRDLLTADQPAECQRDERSDPCGDDGSPPASSCGDVQGHQRLLPTT